MDWASYHGVHPRPNNYTIRDHAEEATRYIEAMSKEQELADLEITGPAVTYKWRPILDQWIDAFPPQARRTMKYVTYHMYGMYQPSPTDPLTASNLLSNEYMDHIEYFGMEMRMAEMNSINSCGVRNISNTMAGTMWTLDVMFRFAELGMLGMDVRTTRSSSIQTGFCLLALHSTAICCFQKLLVTFSSRAGSSLPLMYASTRLETVKTARSRSSCSTKSPESRRKGTARPEAAISFKSKCHVV
jgi:hypothetical protein